MPSDAVVEGVSGAIGGCVATIATYPLMTIASRQATRVRLRTPVEVEETGGKSPAATADKAALAPPPSPSGTIHELSLAIRTSQWCTLFPGLSASLFGTTVSQGIYFYLYSILRQAAVRRRAAPGAGGDSRSAQISVGESLLVAALAGMGNVLLTNPIWMVATRMQTHQQRQQQSSTVATPNSRAPTSDSKTTPSPSSSTSAAPTSPTLTALASATKTAPSIPPPGPVAVARHIYGEYGIGGFWNGCGASLVMVINPTLQYALYEWLSAARARVVARRGGSSPARRPTALEVFMLSAVAKAGATVVTYPLLMVKTRMMSARKTDADMQYTSVANAIMQIGQKEGLLGYYKGIKTKIVQSVLAAALLFMCKEKITDATRELLKGDDLRKNVT